MRELLRTTRWWTWGFVALILLIVAYSIFLTYGVNRRLAEVSDGARAIRLLTAVDDSVRKIESELLGKTDSAAPSHGDTEWDQWSATLAQARTAVGDGGAVSDLVAPFVQKLDGELAAIQHLRARLPEVADSLPETAAARDEIRRRQLHSIDLLQSAIKGVRVRMSEVSTELVGLWKQLIVLVVAMAALSACLSVFLIIQQRDARRLKDFDESLRQNEERFRTLFEENPVGMGIIGLDRRFKRANDTLCTMLGYTHEEMTSRTIADITHADDVEESAALTTQLFAGTIPDFELEKRYVSKSGEIIWVLLNAKIIRDADGKPAFGLGVIQNVNETKQNLLKIRMANEVMNEQRERLQAIFDTEPECVKIVSPDGMLLEMNAAGLRMIGADRAEQVIGGSVINLVHPEDRAAYQARNRAVCRGESGAIQFRMIGLNGIERWMESNSAPLHDQHGKVIGVLSVTRDITARLTEKELIHRADLEQLLFRELDHRVRNNLSSLIALIDLAGRQVKDVPTFAGAVRGRVEVMAAVHSMLTRSHWSPLAIGSLIEAVTPAVHRSAVSMSGEPIAIAPRQVTALGMVIHELMTNCAKYGALTEPGGRVSIIWKVLERRPDAWRIVISWREQGGPPILSVPIPGSGMDLLKGFVKSELHGEPRLTFPESGASHDLTIEVDAAVLQRSASQ